MRACWPRRAGAARLATGAAGAALMVCALAPVLTGRPRPLDPLDLVVYRTAGRSVLGGWALYGPSFLVHSGGHLPFTYPPFAALVMSPLALVPLGADYALWSAVCVVTLWALVRISFRELLLRAADRWRSLAAAALTAAALLTVPVAEHLTLGQVGIPLTLMCVADVAATRTRWPRGLLVGLAAAVKLTPALFVIYFLLTRQWRAAATAAATTAGCWLLAALALSADTRRYFLDRVGFDPARAGAVTEVANQSLWGTAHRWLGSGGQVPWLVASFLVAAFGLYRAWLAQRAADPLAAAALVGLTTLLVSPVSWMHSGVWLVPALAVLVGDGQRRRRVAAAAAAWVLLLVVVPHPATSAATGIGGWVVTYVWHEALVYLYLALLVLLPTRGGAPRWRITYPSTVAAVTNPSRSTVAS